MISALCRILVLAGALIASLPALDLKAVAGPTAPLLTARMPLLLAGWQELTVTSYRLHGIHDPAWDADLVKLLEHIATREAQAPGALAEEDARAIALRLADAGCRDPLAAWASFILATDSQERTTTCSKALHAFADDRGARPATELHPHLLEVMCLGYALATFGRADDPGKHTKALGVAQRLATALSAAIAAKECSACPEILLSQVRGLGLNHQDFGEPVVAAVDVGVQRAQPAPWLGAALRGTVRIGNAWAWRGSGWGNSVTPEGWAGFKSNLTQADAMLTTAWQGQRGEPLIAAYGCVLAGAGASTTPIQEWLLRSASACLDHQPAFDTTFSFLLPRWGGSYAKMLSLGCDCVDTARFDTEVPWNIMKAVDAAFSDAASMKQEADFTTALAAPHVQAALEACFDGYLAKKPEQATRYACNRAALRWLGGRKAEARSALAVIPDSAFARPADAYLGVDLKSVKDGKATGPTGQGASDF
ncbi:MAG: hypothetical protein H0X38_04470 [Planctomycetes bacterium]|nr:hypothetical protein [Planctomycetota bacterium]